jgi:hypothetical protein
MNDFYEQHKDDQKDHASLIYWRPGVTRAEIDKALLDLINTGLVDSTDTRDYVDAFGGPVIYFP